MNHKRWCRGVYYRLPYFRKYGSKALNQTDCVHECRLQTCSSGCHRDFILTLVPPLEVAEQMSRLVQDGSSRCPRTSTPRGEHVLTDCGRARRVRRAMQRPHRLVQSCASGGGVRSSFFVWWSLSRRALPRHGSRTAVPNPNLLPSHHQRAPKSQRLQSDAS